MAGGDLLQLFREWLNPQKTDIRPRKYGKKTFYNSANHHEWLKK